MPTEKITGISFPATFTASDAGPRLAVLGAVASCCAQHLLDGGYFSPDEEEAMLKAYKVRMEAPDPPDFLLFTAEVLAKKHALTVEGEIHRMQTMLVLRWRLSDRLHCWTFGALPGRATSLYDHCASLRSACTLLGCPAILAGDSSVIHVASINPVAVLTAAAWIGHELTIQSGGESPFVFPFMVDLPVWSTLLQRHFAA
ncbi:MAG: hypothetical protein JWO08_729 [Verrucomicrobiaceae bacterium]|nr:hypothetical protein [Verrucomicrobiaceae bacterium]